MLMFQLCYFKADMCCFSFCCCCLIYYVPLIVNKNTHKPFFYSFLNLTYNCVNVFDHHIKNSFKRNISKEIVDSISASHLIIL